MRYSPKPTAKRKCQSPLESESKNVQPIHVVKTPTLVNYNTSSNMEDQNTAAAKVVMQKVIESRVYNINNGSMSTEDKKTALMMVDTVAPMFAALTSVL